MSRPRNTVPSSFPKNYVTLRQLQELRLKEKQDLEVMTPTPNRSPEHNRRAAAEAKRDCEERLRDLHLEQSEGKGPVPADRKPSGSRAKSSSNGSRGVASRRAPVDPPRTLADGAKGHAAGADPKPPIGKAAGENPNAEMNQKKSKRKKKKKTTTTTKGQAGDNNETGEAEAAAEEEVKGSEIMASDPPPEEPARVKQVARRNRESKTAPKNSMARRGEPSLAEKQKESKTVAAAADQSPEKPTQLQLNEVKPARVNGPELKVQIERPGKNGVKESAGAARSRMGGRGGKSSRDGAVMVWVRKAASS